MAMTNVELYEALKGSIPDEAARMIAEAFPQAREIATKHDIAELETRLSARMDALHGTTLRWMFGLFVPMWMGTWATVVAVVLKN